MYPLYYKGLRLSVTFQVKHLCVGDFASFAKIFAGFYFGKGIELKNRKVTEKRLKKLRNLNR